MDINKMVHGCPWRHIQKIHLQVAFLFFPLLNHPPPPSLLFSLSLLSFALSESFLDLWSLQIVYPVVKKYMSAPSAPRLKLVSTPELKALFCVEDVKLPSWVNGMYEFIFIISYVFFPLFILLYVYLFIDFCEGAWLNIFLILKSFYRDRLDAFLGKCLLLDSLWLSTINTLQVMEAVASIDIRRHFIEALALLLGRPLEAEPVCILYISLSGKQISWPFLWPFCCQIFCRRATFLVASGVFSFMVCWSFLSLSLASLI